MFHCPHFYNLFQVYVHTSQRFLYQSSSGSPLPFHILNILLHAANSVLVLCVTKSLAVAALFAAHPVHAEAVCAVVGTADLAYSSVILISLSLARRRILSRSSVYPELLFISTMTCVAVLFKEQGIMLPTVILACDAIYTHRGFHSFTPLPRMKKGNRMFYTKALLYICILLPTILYLRLAAMGFRTPKFKEQDNPAAFLNSIVERFVNRSHIYAISAWILLTPDWLCYDWAMGCVPLIKEHCDPRIIGSVVFWGIFACIIGKKLLLIKSRGYSMGVLLLVLPFLPAANIVFDVGFVIAERNLYLSVAGAAVIVTSAMRSCFKRVYPFAVGFIVVTWLAKSWTRSHDWLNEEALFRSGLRVCPDNAKVHYNVAKTLSGSGKADVAEMEYQRALQLYPEYEQAMNNLANIYRHEKRLSEARLLLDRAVKINPEFPAAWMNLGIVQASLGQVQDSADSYRNALRLRPKYADCHFNLGNLHVKTGDIAAAIEEFEMAIEQRPTHKAAWSNLIMAADDSGRTDLAEARAREATRIFPSAAEFRFHLGNILGKRSEFDSAEEMYLEAIFIGDIDGGEDLSLYHSNLGVLYHRWNRYPEAAKAYEAAIRLDPNNRSAKKNLESVRRNML